MGLWTDICRNQLLKKTDLIVFLNKVDIFRTKIQSGLRLTDYIVSYGERPNTFESTTGCAYLPPFLPPSSANALLQQPLDIRKKFCESQTTHYLIPVPTDCDLKLRLIGRSGYPERQVPYPTGILLSFHDRYGMALARRS